MSDDGWTVGQIRDVLDGFRGQLPVRVRADRGDTWVEAELEVVDIELPGKDSLDGRVLLICAPPASGRQEPPSERERPLEPQTDLGETP